MWSPRGAHCSMFSGLAKLCDGIWILIIYTDTWWFMMVWLSKWFISWFQFLLPVNNILYILTAGSSAPVVWVLLGCEEFLNLRDVHCFTTLDSLRLEFSGDLVCNPLQCVIRTNGCCAMRWYMDCEYPHLLMVIHGGVIFIMVYIMAVACMHHADAWVLCIAVCRTHSCRMSGYYVS